MPGSKSPPLAQWREVGQERPQMALALKVRQRTRLHVAFLRIDGSPAIIAGRPL
jgi:hypothetical protein